MDLGFEGRRRSEWREKLWCLKLDRRNELDCCRLRFKDLKVKFTLSAEKEIDFAMEIAIHYKKKLEVCKKKTEETYSNVEARDEIERLQKEIDKEMELERKLKDVERNSQDLSNFQVYPRYCYRER